MSATVRIICQLVASGTAAHVGGPVETEFRTFDVEAPVALVQWMASQGPYLTKSIIGAEFRVAALSEEERP